MELNCRNDPYYLVLQLDFALPVDVPVAIDVDRLSFQVRRGDGKGGTPDHSAPVIQGKEYAKLA